MMTRRELLRSLGAVGAAAAIAERSVQAANAPELPLEEFGYEQVSVRGERQKGQLANVTDVVMGLNEDSLLYPFRAMSGNSAPGVSLGGWYEWHPHYDHHHDIGGLAPGHNFGQWMSALARIHAGSRFGGAPGVGRLAERAMRMNRLLAESIGPGYFAKTLFPGYSYDKLVCGLMDGHRLLGDAAAFKTLDQVTEVAVPSLPGRAVDREVQWKLGAGIEWMWDETYTMPENLYLISAMGAGTRYRKMAEQYLDDTTYFGPLARGENVLGDRHAYSYVNALCSAMQAYLVGKSSMHLQAARNGFAMLEAQSFATGGWGPDESLRKPGYDELAKSLTGSHNGFETPCGSYAHMKLTRYLLRATRDGQYGDSMERVMLNTVMGALPLQADGRSFYHQDCNVVGKRIYSTAIWPCCSGTLPQVVADYGINSYLREPGAVWVNLYQPSELRWTEGKTAVQLEQVGDYLSDGKARLRVTASAPVRFALRMRVPTWAGEGKTLLVNGQVVPILTQKGFTTVERVWRTGDAVELDTAMSLRLETLPANGGPDRSATVALMWGPLVLFALRETGDTGPMTLTREAMLRAERTGHMEWSVMSGGQVRKMVPFVDVGERTYSTYVSAV